MGRGGGCSFQDVLGDPCTVVSLSSFMYVTISVTGYVMDHSPKDFAKSFMPFYLFIFFFTCEFYIPHDPFFFFLQIHFHIIRRGLNVCKYFDPRVCT
jgi:hypothetical protein